MRCPRFVLAIVIAFIISAPTASAAQERVGASLNFTIGTPQASEAIARLDIAAAPCPTPC